MPIANPDLIKQVHFSGEALCDGFRPNPYRPNFCAECNKLFDKHTPESFENDDSLIQAISHSLKHEKVPDCILPAEGKLGGLYQGGMRSVMNPDVLKSCGITHIVNTAKGLEIFGPKFPEAVKKAQDELGIQFLNLDWEDTLKFTIPDEAFVECIKFIHSAREKGGSVLVHCAQGKSRSATAVISYIITARRMALPEALQLVQASRKMADPNPAFKERLKLFQTSTVLGSLQAELGISS